ncbi:MAG: DUF4417 domain-containing protein [Gammaproteobacteria bacterium]|nr:DUF4417 domain-containing protein [Gammaproteobacteria bacterium]
MASNASKLFDDPDRHPLSLGCTACPHKRVCGGIHVGSGVFDCLDYCCRVPTRCDSVCVRSVDSFVDRVHEIGGFSLDDIPRTQPVSPPRLPALVPLVYHGSSRHSSFYAPAVALSLYSLLDRATGELKYSNREHLCEAFRVSTQAALLVTGTHDDRPLERWWALGPIRKKTLGQLAEIGIAAITSPNYSLFSDTPRWDDLHAQKRIAITWQEMQSAGLPAGLHVNARTAADWCRWRGFVRNRPEVSVLAFEFATGARYAKRLLWYTNHLRKLADDVGRPLTLVIRGGAAVVSQLRDSYASVCSVDPTPFIKAVKRQRAKLREHGGIDWHSMAGNGSMSVDELFGHNYLTVARDRLPPRPRYPDRN